jgi:hypothetical protein
VAALDRLGGAPWLDEVDRDGTTNGLILHLDGVIRELGGLVAALALYASRWDVMLGNHLSQRN